MHARRTTHLSLDRFFCVELAWSINHLSPFKTDFPNGHYLYSKTTYWRHRDRLHRAGSYGNSILVFSISHHQQFRETSGGSAAWRGDGIRSNSRKCRCGPCLTAALSPLCLTTHAAFPRAFLSSGVKVSREWRDLSELWSSIVAFYYYSCILCATTITVLQVLP